MDGNDVVHCVAAQEVATSAYATYEFAVNERAGAVPEAYHAKCDHSVQSSGTSMRSPRVWRA